MSDEKKPEFRSAQYEFTDEQNKVLSAMVDSMKVVGGMMKILGLVFLIFFGMEAYKAAQGGTNYGPAVGLGSGALFCLVIAFWTGASAGSFRKIVDTKNEDIWHLMNALRHLHSMYSFLKTIVIGSLVLLLVGLALAAYEGFSTKPAADGGATGGDVRKE
ncbi:MAG TPA: hypothetical protein VMZ71_05390 [Gemmataceae bacterium]|nr:hypothetical protein [Gemmataceae bacterium]